MYNVCGIGSQTHTYISVFFVAEYGCVGVLYSTGMCLCVHEYVMACFLVHERMSVCVFLCLCVSVSVPVCACMTN